MVTKELLDYIEFESSKGFPFGAVKNALLKQGWKTEDIDEARTTIEGKLEKKTIATSIASNTYEPKKIVADNVTPPIQNEVKLPQYSPFLKQKPTVTNPPIAPTKTTTLNTNSPVRSNAETVESIEAPKNIPTTWEKAPGSHPWMRFFAILALGLIIAGISYLYNSGKLPWLTSLLHQI